MCTVLVLLLAVVGLAGGCSTTPRVGDELKRRGDEIVVAGQLFHTGTPVVLWGDPGGYDAYRNEKRFVPWARASWKPPEKGSDGLGTPNRYGIRFAPRPERGETDTAPLTPEEFERVRGGGWDLALLQQHVDQFVLHYDVCGVSQQCFRILHDVRGLSVHFLLDIDGTIYQTMDVKEKGWHATISNNRSVGIEIANIGAYSKDESVKPLQDWYDPDPPAWDMMGQMDTRVKQTNLTIPPRLGDGGLRAPGTYQPIRPNPVVGEIQGRELRQYDLSPEQYDALIRLTAALHVALPKIALDYPRDEEGRLITRELKREQWEAFQGVLGHYHIQDDKVDPGPGLQWDRVVNGARKLLRQRPLAAGDPYGADQVESCRDMRTNP